jgi:hypothetical protein
VSSQTVRADFALPSPGGSSQTITNTGTSS